MLTPVINSHTPDGWKTMSCLGYPHYKLNCNKLTPRTRRSSGFLPHAYKMMGTNVPCLAELVIQYQGLELPIGLVFGSGRLCGEATDTEEVVC